MPIRKPGAGPSSRIPRRKVLEAARRFYLHGETQTAIAADLGVSNSYLARLLKDAREQGWVKIIVDSDRETELAAALMAKYPHLVHCEVVPTGSTPEDTARAIGTAMANWFDELLDRDEESADPQVRKVAIGGAWPHQFMVDAVVRRRNRVSVGPTALTPSPARMDRYTAPVVAAKLADRLGALGAGSATPPGSSRTGFLYSPTFKPPRDSLPALQRFFEDIKKDPDYRAMLDFWMDVDVAFLSVVAPQWRYSDVHDRLSALGLSTQNLIDRGATAVVANRFLDGNGRDVPLAEGVPSYEVAMPTEAIRAVMERHAASGGRRGFVVLDAWGEPGVGGRTLLQAGVVNILLCDASTGVQIASPPRPEHVQARPSPSTQSDLPRRP
ncbi:hypothetical protein HY631_04535 [Candidatus Uhrbacteria bacterium]|nr:hypothetical protein [Candidatus Uhrbacteria bacterium]